MARTMPQNNFLFSHLRTVIESDSIELKKLIDGFQSTMLISTAVRLGIFDVLREQHFIASELAQKLSLDAVNLERFLKGLTILGLVCESSDEISSYSLSAKGSLLCTESGPMADYALLCASQYLPAWTHLHLALTEGQIPFESAFKQDVWSYRQTNDSAGALFDGWLRKQTSTVLAGLTEVLNPMKLGLVGDVGGGQGALLAELLKACPERRGILFEQGHVLSLAGTFMQSAGVQDRCVLQETDFFKEVPKGCDTYILKSVLHDWADEPAVHLLKKIRAAMSASTRLIVIERILPEKAHDAVSTTWLDLTMMVVTGGLERSLREYENLFSAASLKLHKTISTNNCFHLLEVECKGT